MQQMQQMQWAAAMEMENRRLQQIAAAQAAMIRDISQEIHGAAKLGTNRKQQKPKQPPALSPWQSMEPLKIAVDSPQSTACSEGPAFSYMSPLPSPGSLSPPLSPPMTPPGLAPCPPPGLEPSDEETENPGLTIEMENPSFSISSSPLEGVTATWTIANPEAKLRVSCGSALVSPPLSGLAEGLRLLFSPGEKWLHDFQAKKAKKCKKSAERHPRFGALQLKFAGERTSTEPLTLIFTVGKVRLQPVTACAGEGACRVELPRDWRLEVEGGSLTVGVEVIETKQ
mmetsp:Transcript_71997/g.171983  ORF Transcript_71997/g.171983 Transcript_71997/m.171983 type:complete len:284 (+) Transcript_71997:1-852(+)